MKQTIRTFFAVFFTLFLSLSTGAQTVAEELRDDVNRSAGLYYALPVPAIQTDTAPKGKKPFYINHYGSPASYYLLKAASYEAPYATLAKADSLGKLTTLGHDVLQRVNQIRLDAQNRTGEITQKGTHQARAMMRQMMERFPDMLVDNAYYSARSAMHNHCIETMNEAMLQLAGMHHPMQLNIRASQREEHFMDPEDKFLTSQRTDSLTLAKYAEFTAGHTDDTRLMASLFNDSAYVASAINTADLSQQLFLLAGCIQHTDLAGKVMLYDIFHFQQIEGNITNTIKNNIDWIGHIHGAGVPARCEITDGEVDYRFVLNVIKETGYDRYFGLEFFTFTDREDKVRKSAQLLGTI